MTYPKLQLRQGRCLIIAEIAQAHDGSLGTAHAYIDAAAKAGADAIKFQTHIAAAESSPAEPWRVKFSKQDASRYDYWKRMEFTPEQWAGLADHAREKGISFLSSPFSIEAAELLLKVGVEAWKIASGELGNEPLLRYLTSTDLPFLISSGMSPITEVDQAVSRVQDKGLPLAVLQCTSAYPCPPEKVGLNMMQEFRRRYGCFVGLSDHSGTIYPGLAAATLGAEVLEIHIAFSRECFGPDVPASITTGELAQLVEGIRFTEKMLANPVNKNDMAGELEGLRKLFTKSIAARAPIAAGAVIREADLTVKKPGTGIPADRMHEFIGQVAARDIPAGEFLAESDIQVAAHA
ncbi:MAG: N-acetylneuraminate synthase family protein [Bryobacteraceae bacterium]